MSPVLKIAFVTHLCPRYRVRTFEALSAHHDVDFYLYAVDGLSPSQWQRAASHTNLSAPYLRVFRVGRVCIAPTLISRLWAGEYDVFIKCMNGRIAMLVTYLVARLKRRPFVLWSGIWMRVQTPVARLFFPLMRYIYRHADALVVYGEHVKRYWVSEGVKPDRIFVAAHALDNKLYAGTVSEEARAALLQELDVAKDKKVVLYKGRLAQGKGLNYLLEAFASLNRDDSVLVLAGSGPEEARLRSAADRMGITEKVRFAGEVPIAETARYFALARVSVLASVTTPGGRETWGLEVNMAFNQGVPVVVSDAIGAAAGDLVQNDVNGLVVPERNAAAIAESLRLLLDDPELHARLSANARSTIARWDNDRMILGFRQAIAHVTGKGQVDCRAG